MKVKDFLTFLKSAADYNGRRIYFDSAKTIWSGDKHRGYVWGGQGQVYTKELAESWHARAKAGSKSVPSSRNKNSYFIGDCSKWIDYIIDDCSGLLVDALRSYDPTFGDRGSATWISQCKTRGKMKDMPDVPGLILWRSGHVGVYIGGGMQIEARGTDYGVVVSPVSSQKWTDWGYSNHIDYGETQAETPATLQRGDKGAAVKHVQELLMAAGYPLPKFGADGDFGAETETAVKAFQFEWGLAVNGVVSEVTLRALEDAAKPEVVTETVTDIELAPEVTEYHAITTGDVRLRTGPGEDFDKIATMPKGKRLIALPEKNGWCEACLWLDGKWTQGYVSEKYVKAV